MIAISRRALARKATQLLRQKGFTPTGRRIREIRREQVEFERRLVSTPMGGKPKK